MSEWLYWFDWLDLFGFLHLFLWPMVTLFLAVSLLIGWRLTRRNGDTIAFFEGRMDKNDFTILSPRSDIWGVLIGIALWIVLFLVPLAHYPISRADTLHQITFYTPYILYLIWKIYRVLYSISWRVHVVGDRIYYSSFFKLKTYTFSEIKDIKICSRIYSRIILCSSTKKMFSIRQNSIGYNVFADRILNPSINDFGKKDMSDKID